MKCECHKNVSTSSPVIRVIDFHHRVGCNVSLGTTLLETLTQPASQNCHAIQLFLGSPKSYNCRTLSATDKEQSLNYCNKWNKSFYIHCPYVANLSKDPETLYDYKSILSKSVRVIQKELEQIKGLPGSCILHTGAKGTIQNVIDNINDLEISRGHHRNEKPLLLENAAGQGTSLGRSWEEYRKIYEGIDKNVVGFCVDTQHLFGAGTTDFSDHESVIKMFDKCQEVYGSNPDVIHLNDSKISLNGKKDRHANIGEGYIWHKDDESLKSLLNYCYDQDIDVILETPNPGSDLNKIRSQYMDLETIDIVSIS